MLNGIKTTRAQIDKLYLHSLTKVYKDNPNTERQTEK
jgi:hypothetical protein